MSFGPHEPGMPLRKRSRWWWLGPLASFVIFGASLVVLWHIISGMEPGQLAGAFENASLRQLGLAVAFTAQTDKDGYILFYKGSYAYDVAERLIPDWMKAMPVEEVEGFKTLRIFRKTA